MGESLNLYRLQKLDTSIDHIKNRLNEIERILGDDSRIRSAQKNLEVLQSKSKQTRILLHQIEDKVEAQRIKRQKAQSSLFSGKIKNPKDLQDLQRESEALKQYISQLEDEQLEVMIANEAAENADKRAKKELEQLKGTLAEENASLLGEKNKLEEDLQRYLREKEAVLQSLPSKSLQEYHKLRGSKNGIAVTVVSEGSCSICGQSITPGDLQSIRTSSKLVFCPTCGRILFME